MRVRLYTAAAALGLGFAFCLGMNRLQPLYAHPLYGQAQEWLLTAIPFAGLAALIVAGLSRQASVRGWIVLAALTAIAFAAGDHNFAGSSHSGAVLFFQVFYGLIVVIHLGGHLRGAGKAPLHADPVTARRIAIALGIFTVLAASPAFAPWVDGTGTEFAFGLAFAAPLWLSTVFAMRQVAVGRPKRSAPVYLWFGAALVGLFVLFIAVALSHVALGGE
jgi:hypothetical protein